MRRPSFQFYPADWAANPNLKRCTLAERGLWLEVMCLMHDQDHYGVIRWPLKEIAQAVGCKPAELQALARKGVLKGSDSHLTEAFVYVPRSGRKDGNPVTLISSQAGPIWFSSRMVKDEHVRVMRGEGTGGGDTSKATPKGAPKPPIGEAFGPRGSSSSSSPSGKGHAKPSASHPAAPGGKGSQSAERTPTIPCPYGAIVDAYHQELPNLPKVRLMDGPTWLKRQKAMRSMWGWVLRSKRDDGSRRATTAEEALQWIRDYFAQASHNDFLMGRTPRAEGHANWQCDIDFLLTEKGMRQVIEKTQEAA